MRKLIISISIFFITALLACQSKSSKNTPLVKTDSIAIQPASIQSTSPTKQNGHHLKVDQMIFIEYLDDGDYLQLLAKKGDSTVGFINETDTTRNLKRGDSIQVTWKHGMITFPGDNDSEQKAQLLLSVKKISDGPVSKFRKQYGKSIKYTWATTEEFTSWYLDKVYLLTEYYLSQTQNPLLQLAIKNHDQLTYSIETGEKAGRSYRMIGIAPVGPNGSNVVQWLYVDEESGKSYEYDLAEDKLIEFN